MLCMAMKQFFLHRSKHMQNFRDLRNKFTHIKLVVWLIKIDSLACTCMQSISYMEPFFDEIFERVYVRTVKILNSLFLQYGLLQVICLFRLNFVASLLLYCCN